MENEEQRLEKFIQDNRSDFDVFEVPKDLWAKIALEKFVEDNRSELDVYDPPEGLWSGIALEKFVEDNRSELDVHEPPEGLWNQIAKDLPAKKQGKVITLKVRTLMRVAAAIVILLVAFIGFQLLQKQKEEPTLATLPNLEQISPELAEAEVYYSSLISQKQKEIKTFPLEKYDLGEDFYTALNELDTMYTKLKTELYQVPSKEQVVDAMIRNLQMRIEVLNRQLAILKQIQKFKNEEKDENISI